jgi:hypothetical protein
MDSPSSTIGGSPHSSSRASAGETPPRDEIPANCTEEKTGGANKRLHSPEPETAGKKPKPNVGGGGQGGGAAAESGQAVGQTAPEVARKSGTKFTKPRHFKPQNIEAEAAAGSTRTTAEVAGHPPFSKRQKTTAPHSEHPESERQSDPNLDLEAVPQQAASKVQPTTPFYKRTRGRAGNGTKSSDSSLSSSSDSGSNADSSSDSDSNLNSNAQNGGGAAAKRKVRNSSDPIHDGSDAVEVNASGDLVANWLGRYTKVGDGTGSAWYNKDDVYSCWKHEGKWCFGRNEWRKKNPAKCFVCANNPCHFPEEVEAWEVGTEPLDFSDSADGIIKVTAAFVDVADDQIDGQEDDAADDQGDGPEDAHIARKGESGLQRTLTKLVEDKIRKQTPAEMLPVEGGCGEGGGHATAEVSSKRAQESVVHPPQKARAHELFDKVKAAVQTGKYSRIEFRLHGPNLNSLQKQNVDRLEAFARDYRRIFGDAFLEGRVSIKSFAMQNNFGKDQQGKRDALFEEIKKNPETLFLMICDEAHHAATTLTGSFINHDTLRCSTNVITLFVSATPYNMMTTESQIPASNVVTWKDSKADGISSDSIPYRGLPFFQERRHDCDAPQDKIPGGSLCEADRGFQTALTSKAVKRLSKGLKGESKNQMDLISTLVTEFVGALALCDKKETPARNQDVGECLMYPQGEATLVQKSMTHRMVRDLVNLPVQNKDRKGCLVVIRQPQRTGEDIAEAIRNARDKLGLQRRFAVLTDLNERVGCNNLGKYFETQNKQLFDQLTSTNGGKERSFEKYEDLEGISCILILCQKGKMGACAFLDLLHFYN